MLNATFVMEQHVGHRTYYENLRRCIDVMPQVRARWVEVTYESQNSGWSRLPLLSQKLKGALIGHHQVRAGLGRGTADVAVFNTQVPAILGGKMSQKQPYVLCTDITPLQYDAMAEHYGHRSDYGGPLTWYKHWANTRLMQKAAMVVPWSHWAAHSIIDDYGVDPERVTVIPPGVDLTVWHPHPTEIGDRSPMRILFVGGDFFRKGGDDLLAAFRALPEGCAELVLVTRTKLPEEEGILIYNDMRPNSPELIALYQTCDVFVLPTKAEAFGIATVEASAIGLPVVATRVGGITDIVVDGETGLGVPPGDVGMLTRHLRMLAENGDMRQRLGRGARIRAEQRFDARANAAKMVDLLQQIVR